MGYGSIVALIIASAFGGGWAMHLFDAWRSAAEHKISRRADYLEKQLLCLCGPIAFILGQNKSLMEFARRARDAYRDEFEIPQFSQEAATQKSVHDQAMSTIETTNAFVKQVMDNNDLIAKKLFEYYAYVDIADAPLFQDFMFE